MLRVSPGASFEATTDAFAAGLTGTLGVRIRDGAGGTFLNRTTGGIVQDLVVGAAALYRRTFTAPTVAGQWWLVWDDGTSVHREELVVTSSALSPAVPAGTDLCVLADVVRYIPGYVSEPDTDDTLQAKITAQSVDIIRRTGREFVAIAPEQDPRRFDVTDRRIRRRVVPIGDATAIDTVTLLRTGGTDRTDISPGDYVERPRVRQPWEPIVELWFPSYSGSPIVFQIEDVIEVSATWGCPQIPADIRQACAQLVILRYMTDVAGAGTAFADAVRDSDINLAGLFRSAEEVIARWSPK